MIKLDSHAAGRHFLQIPGPSPVPDRILRAMSHPTIDHRGPECAKLGLKVLDGDGEGDGDCAAAGCMSATISARAATAASTPGMKVRRTAPIMLSARTAWLWDHQARSHRRNR